MNTRISLITMVTGVAVIVLGTANSANAGLLIYEGFSGYTTVSDSTSIKGQMPGASSVGLNKSTAWAGTATTSPSVLSTGLTFGSLQTSGGAISVTTGTHTAGAQITATVAAGTTIWSSYLANFSAQGSGATDGLLMRISDSVSDSGSRFNTWADSRSSSTSVGVSYTNVAGANGATGLSLNTTYIIISSFTNAGGIGGGTATTWALTESQFESFVLDGGTETFLRTSGSVSATATEISSTQKSFSGFLNIASVNDSAMIDEIRWGTSLADVTPTAVPEPSTYALFVGLGIGLLTVARRIGRHRS